MNPTSNEQRAGILTRTAKEVRSYKVIMRILGISLGAVSLLVVIVYAVAALYKQSGSFTISVDRYDMTEFGLTLSDKPDSAYNNSTLNAKISEKMTCIAESDIPENVDSFDGQHNGSNYIAYTFYLKNSGQREAPYDYEISLANVTNGLDEALRVRLYVDGIPTTYAKTKNDGSGPEPGTVEFDTQSTVVRARNEIFPPGDMTKFTVVIWIEGNDPECVDTIIGGQLKLDMKISVIDGR